MLSRVARAMGGVGLSRCLSGRGRRRWGAHVDASRLPASPGPRAIELVAGKRNAQRASHRRSCTRRQRLIITDAFGPYEVFARSPAFFVYSVGAGPTAMLSGALAVAPDYSLDDVDAGVAPEPDVVVVPAVVAPWRQRGLATRVAHPPGRPGRAVARSVCRRQGAGLRGPTRRSSGHLTLVEAQWP